jgi:hypothetical protein
MITIVMFGDQPVFATHDMVEDNILALVKEYVRREARWRGWMLCFNFGNYPDIHIFRSGEFSETPEHPLLRPPPVFVHTHCLVVR